MLVIWQLRIGFLVEVPAVAIRQGKIRYNYDEVTKNTFRISDLLSK